MNIYINNKKYEVEKHTTYYDIANMFQKDYNEQIFAVKNVKGISELSKYCEENDIIEFIFYSDRVGFEMYIRTAIFLISKCIYENIDTKYNIHSSLKFRHNDSFYISPKESDYIYTDEDVNSIINNLNTIIKNNYKINRTNFDIKDAIRISKDLNNLELSLLLKYLRENYVYLYEVDNFKYIFFEPLLYSTGYIKNVDIQKFHNGIIVSFPKDYPDNKINEFKPNNKIFNVQYEGYKWSEKLKVNSIGLINSSLSNETFNDIVILQESFQETKIGELASNIAKSKKILVFISGPSCSGKTTFSHRLKYHLLALGLHTIQISVDNYFVDRELSPKDEFGNYNFETLKSVDIVTFNNDINKLLKGERVNMPTYNFITGKREYNDNYIELKNDTILLIEGIHCLNNELTYDLDSNDKFLVYISPLSVISIDDLNRIPTSDLRLIRRIVRDYNTRGFSAKDTIKMWNKVRQGEEINIFPYQENADIIFNSSFIYELSILKGHIEPLLFDIDRDEPEYEVARRLLKYLSFFLNANDIAVPKYSILREFIGGSIIKT